MNPFLRGRMVVTAGVVLTLAGASVSANQAAREANPASASAEAIREHIDEAEDVVDSMLEWRLALTTSSAQPEPADAPIAPATTLMSLERSRVERVSRLLGALDTLIPPSPSATATPRGDLRAHLEKAQEIARELTAPAPTRIAGTSGSDGRLVTIDRTALQRLEVEIDAMERLARREPRKEP